MMRIQYMHQILRELRRTFGVAVRDMGNEVYQVSKRDDAILRRRGGRLQEDLVLGFILAILAPEVVLVGSASPSVHAAQLSKKSREVKY